MIVNYDFGSGELSTIFKKNFEEVSKEVDSFFTKTQGLDLSNFAKNANGFDDLIDKLNITDTSLINFLTDVNQSEKSLTAYQKYLKQTSSATSTLSTITAGAGKVMKIFAATAVNAFASVVVAKVIQEIYEAYDQWANRIEYAADAMESANTSYEAAETELNKVRSEIEKINAQMLELEKTESGEFVNKEEYDRLKASREELEASVKLHEAKLRLEARKSLDASTNWFSESQKMTSGTSAEYSESAIENRASGIVNGDMKRWFTGDKAEDNITDEKGNINFLLGAYQGLGNLYDQNNQLIKEGADALAEKGETDLKYAAMSIESLTNENSELAASKDLVEVYLHEYKANLQQLVNSYNELQNGGGIVSDEETKQYNAAIALISIINDTLGITAETSNTASDSISNHASTVESSLKKTKAEMISELNALSSGFESLDKIMKSQKDDSAFDYGLLSDNDFVETFGELGDVYTDFVEIISESPKDVKTCQNAYDNLVTAWINSEGVLRGVSEETANVTEARLKSMGVTNAAEVVEFALAQQKAKVAWETRESTDAIADEVVELLSESETVDDTTQAWAAYVAQKMLNEVHDGSGDILQLRNVMEALGLGIKAWEAYAHAKKMAIHSQGTFGDYEVVDEGTDGISVTKVSAESSRRGWEKVANATFDEINQQINALIDNSLDIEYGGGNKSTDTSSKPSGSSSSNKQEEIDWIARKNELLQKQHDIQEQIANDETVSYNERKAALLDLIEKDKTLVATAEESAEKYKQAWLEASDDLTASDRAKIANESDNMNIEKYDAKDLLEKGIVGSLEDGEKYIENLKKSIEYYDLWKEYEQTAVDKKKEGTEHQKNSIRLLKEEIGHQKDLNAAIADQVTSRQELMEAQGKYINTGTYEELIRLSKEEESLHQDSIDTLYEELDLADEYTSEWYGILAEIESAENAIAQCKIQQEELNDQIKRLPIDRIQMFRDMYAQIVEDMDNYMSIQASMGLKPTKEELQQYIDLYNEQIDSALKQQNKLKDLLTNYEYGSEKFNNTSQEIQDLDNEISSLLTNINEMNHQILQIPIQEMSEQIENLASAKATLERSIAEDNEKGLATTISQYEKLNQLTLQQLQALSKQRNALVGLLSVYDENSDKYADIKAQIDSVSQSISDLVIQQYQWNSEILQIPSDKLEDLNNNLQTYSSILDASLSEMDSVLSGVIGVIEQQTDAIEEQRKASEEMYDERIERIEKEKELLTSTNNDRKLQLDYEQALYNLDRAKSQKSIQVVRDGKLDYEADQDAIRDAQTAKADAEFNLVINNLEKQIEALEAEKETILEGYDEQLDKLDEVKNKWSEIAEQIQQAADIAKADEFFGDGWADKVLLGTDSDIFNLFKDLYSSTSEQRDSINEQITSNERLVQMMGEFVERYKEGSLTYDNALINISNLIQSMEGGYSALENLSGMMNLDNILGLENITTSTQAQIDKSAELLEQYMQIVESNKQSVEGFETNWDSMSGSVNSTIDAFNNAVDSIQSYLDVFNNNTDAINENTSTWEEMKENIESQVEALKKAAEELEKLANTQKVSSGSSSSKGSGSGSSSKGGTYLTVNGTSYLETSNGYVDKNTGNSGGSVAEVIGKYGSEKEKEDYYELRKNQISNSPQSKNEGWEKAALEALDEEMKKAGVTKYHDGIKNGPVDGKMSDDQLWDYARKIALDPLRADEVVKILQKGEGVFQPDQIRNVMQNSELVGRMSADASALGAVTNMSRNNTIDCSIGQVHLHEIKDVDEFANAMKQTFASSMRQNFTEIFKK